MHVLKMKTIHPEMRNIPIRMTPCSPMRSNVLQENNLVPRAFGDQNLQFRKKSFLIIPQCVQVVAALPSNDQTGHIWDFTFTNLKKTDMELRIRCTLEHYYGAVCECGHETKARLGEGVVSRLEGRKEDLKLTEYSMVGPMLVSFISALSVRYKMSRVKIREFLSYWLGA